MLCLRFNKELPRKVALQHHPKMCHYNATEFIAGGKKPQNSSFKGRRKGHFEGQKGQTLGQAKKNGAAKNSVGARKNTKEVKRNCR